MWLYRSPSIAPYDVSPPPIAQLTKPRFATVPVRGALLRTLSANVQVEGTSYVVELAEPVGEYFAMLGRFRTLAIWFLPDLLLLSWAVGYWLCRRALAPVDEIANTAREISARNLSLRLAVPRTGDELARLSETLNGMIARLEKAFNRISGFTADAAHELRTPIALILTTSELALRPNASHGEWRQALDEIRNEAVRTKCLIEDLMTLARSDFGEMSVQPLVLDLSETVWLAYSRCETLAKSKHIEFAASIPEKNPQARGDPQALARLFAILIDNALKYSPCHGRVSLSLSETNSNAVCEVADNGIGISEEELPHIFERFYRADRARSRDGGGAGLGLAIAHSIARAHGGVIEVESALGIGSVFRVQIPTVKSQAGDEQASKRIEHHTNNP